MLSVELLVVGVPFVVLIALLIWGVWNHLVWRLLAVLGMGTGAGLLVWGILLAALKDRPPLGLPVSPAAIIAVGAGVLVSSVALLVVSFCRGRA